MERATDGNCPRCGGAVPNEVHRGQYPGALSRVADIEICSMCGEDEALARILTGEEGLVPREAWPIPRADVERRMSRLYATG